MSQRTGYRLRVTRPDGERTYLVRYEGKPDVHYLSAGEQPLALSNLVGAEAAELRFRLEDALNARYARPLVEHAVMRNYPHGGDKIKVEVI